ncbi:hypothetical protein BH23THE1_BH23THE1_16910 [soil metagenome]
MKQNKDALVPVYLPTASPGAAQSDSPYHYYPPAINAPVETSIGWFNNNFGQPHTVTSGAPNGSDGFLLLNLQTR